MRARSRKTTLDKICFSEERDAQAFVALRRRRRRRVVVLVVLLLPLLDDG
jgi:hypothetical protein